MVDDSGPRPKVLPAQSGKPSWMLGLLFLVVAGLPGYGIFQWFFCRIEVPAFHIVVLTAKTGEDLTSGQVLAKAGQKGIQFEHLKAGRHFRNPLFWDWEVHEYIGPRKGDAAQI